jgi:transposase
MSDKEIISLLLTKNAELEERIIELEDEIRRLKLGKNSSNSSKPPSSDIYKPKKNQSLRTKSGKKSGGQAGHIGTTLRICNNPDEIIDLYPNHCNKCDCQLDEANGKEYTCRLEIDLPPVKPITTEFRITQAFEKSHSVWQQY